MMIPFLILSLAAIGLNLLTGYTGLLSLGTGAFMGVGAYACYKLETFFPQVNILVWIVASGFVSALVGVAFGLPSLRIKGFYLASRRWRRSSFSNGALRARHGSSTTTTRARSKCRPRPCSARRSPAPPRRRLSRYLVVLTIVAAMTWVASNIVHGRIGRMWMAVRDMDIAAELIGIRLLRAKLLAFAVSSFYVGVAGALMVFLWLGAAEAEAFDINLSFQVLFIIIIGGLGSIVGAFFGATVMHLLPIALRALPAMVGLSIEASRIDQLTFMITGILIILFLIVEPHGLARLWQTAKQKLRVWPFPY